MKQHQNGCGVRGGDARYPMPLGKNMSSLIAGAKSQIPLNWPIAEKLEWARIRAGEEHRSDK